MVFMCTLLFDRGVVGFASPDHAGFLGADLRYWTPGDKYAYEAREEKFKIDDQGDTTLVYRQSERRVFEILSQTKDRYKIRLTYGDYMTTDKEDQLVHDAIVSATGPCVVEFETDETGSLLGIANLETLVAQAEASVEPAVRVMRETIPSAERKNFPKKNFRKYMAQNFFPIHRS